MDGDRLGKELYFRQYDTSRDRKPRIHATEYRIRCFNPAVIKRRLGVLFVNEFDTMLDISIANRYIGLKGRLFESIDIVYLKG